MYFCRLLSMLILALFSSLSWSVSDVLPVSSGYDALTHRSAIESERDKFRIQLPKIQETDPNLLRHTYPVSLKVAGVPVEAKQEIFEGGLQVLHFDLSRIQKINDISELPLSEFQQLIFMLSRSSKTAVMRFYPLAQIAEIETNHLRIETELPEEELIRKDLPELLGTKAAHQLLLAVKCALNSMPVTGTTAACHGGVLEKLDENHLFFEASPHYSYSSEWQLQANSSESVELMLNGTTQLILTLDSHGFIVKGDVINSEEPSDMMEEKSDDQQQDSPGEKDQGSSDDKSNDKGKDSTPPPPGANDASGGAGGDGGGKEPPQQPSSSGVNDEEEEEEEDEEEEEYDDYLDIQDQLLGSIERNHKGRTKHLHTQKQRSDSQSRKMKKQTGIGPEPQKPKTKEKKARAATSRR